MFATTKHFLDYFGLKKLEDLPPLADLSDWESLRVQLNLPEVEEDTSEDDGAVHEIPVLYPEVGEDDEDDEVDEVDENEEDLELPSLDEEELVVSEWPDPAESGG
jgi:segregation and condensation protein B